MDLTYATILVLAAMMFVLAGMIGYLYWQQTRMLQHLHSLALVVTSIAETPPELPAAPEVAAPVEEQSETKAEPEATHEDDEDDRVSVSAPTPAPIDIDDLDGKSKDQLREMLDKKGIPWSKRDNKTQLIELLKATA